MNKIKSWLKLWFTMLGVLFWVVATVATGMCASEKLGLVWGLLVMGSLFTGGIAFIVIYFDL